MNVYKCKFNQCYVAFVFVTVFYNMVFITKPKLYIASQLSPPSPHQPVKISGCTSAVITKEEKIQCAMLSNEECVVF
jgi:hypothetical protein